MDGCADCCSGLGSHAAVNNTAANLSFCNTPASCSIVRSGADVDATLRATQGSTLNHVQGKACQRRLLVTGLHIQARLVHGLDDLVE
jgi:hypothetical protein